MKISYLNPQNLTPYEKNSKFHPEHQIKALMDGIKEFGFDQPIVVDQNMVIIKGHGRREAALRLKLKEVPVVIREVSATEAKFLRVSDNAVPSGEWDSSALRTEMVSLKNSGFDLNITGFDLPAQELILSAPVAKVNSDIELGDIVTTHECGKCSYRW